MFRISLRALLSFAVAMALGGLAWAHTESELAKPIPPHGGLLAAAGGYHAELTGCRSSWPTISTNLSVSKGSPARPTCEWREENPGGCRCR